MLVVVSYDVSDDRRRTRIAKAMEDFGVRVQFSVFECELTEERLQKLRKVLMKEMSQTDDSIRFYRLCARDRQTIEILGRGTVRQDENLVIL